MNMKDLHNFFLNELNLMYDGEKQIVKALPNVIKAAHSPKLKEALRHHLEETKNQVVRLETIFEELGQVPSRIASKAMERLLEEADKVIHSDYTTIVKDAAIINCAQHVEHFEIATYGTLKSLAKNFKLDNIHKLLEENSKEEGNANKKLTEIAEGTFFEKGINAKAYGRAA